ncbi:LysM peptidoglycan-binding domain-containing protein [Alicyclobacillus macrosporangiidus]|uniref:LysM domain-containing protein n=1 Tax=Alicyclobacillus macrosporangiidus TaxID=392015 RepID=A0A1I7IZA9_9BACL|nr:LysM peptidoglycan-binding domain-containing protein [Alicyclobacillus macrosporangiidus]SFU78222.1 LysM domain-containing protein [Alicyclobacillus macrosporangiidus]
MHRPTLGPEGCPVRSSSYLKVLAVLVGALCFATAAMAVVPHSRLRADAWTRVQVAPGDTLYELARRFDPADDYRVVVRSILEANHLPSAQIYPGQTLRIPLHNG